MRTVPRSWAQTLSLCCLTSAFTLLADLPAAHGQGDDGRSPGIVQVLDPDAPCSADPLDLTGVVLPLDVSRVDEDRLLASGRRPAIVPVAAADERFHPEREPVLVVHGIRADFGDVAALVRRLGEDQVRYQVHVLAYDETRRRTSLNGDDLAPLLVSRFGGRRLAIVAHSMGGIVVRRALDRLALEGRLGAFPALSVLAVDTPWHGYPGPSDGFGMSFVRPFMPDGFEDMRARSPMFAGDPRAADPVDRAGLYGVELPANVRVDLVFAQRGDTALDHTELPEIAGQLARRLDLEPFEPGVDIRVRHAVTALAQSSAGRAILAERVPLTARCVRAALERLVPRLAGDHSTVLAGEPFFVALGRFLDVELERPR